MSIGTKMTSSSRRIIVRAGVAGAFAAIAAVVRRAYAAEVTEIHRAHGTASHTAAQPGTRASRQSGAYTPIVTLNGSTLPYAMKDGVKEFHLTAEPIEHEFAPGCAAKCWGYNGRTPGPTIEAVEGDRVRILVTNRLPEHTSIHWHGILLPSGMDGVGGLNQRHIKPGETYAYEFTLRQHGTHMYHPHGDEMVQLAVGMMGLFVIHPKEGEAVPIDRDYCFLLHNWALAPGTYRPDPSIMIEFDLWTFNSKVFPAIDPIVACAGERIRIRIGNLSMWNHPIHLHGHQFVVSGSDGGRWPQSLWRPETTEIVGVGQTRDIEFVAVPGDWALHCHMSHHTMNAMGHGIPNPLGVDQSQVSKRIQSLLPGYVAMGEGGMAEHAAHLAGGQSMSGTAHAGHHKGGIQGPRNTLPMMVGEGPFGPLEMGGMFTVVKVREDLTDSRAAGWYHSPNGTVARRIR
ncbi:MAG: multicopper oxidase family protein [Gammaproteobacteria bacterium]